MGLPRVEAWSNPAEWEKVYRLLYSLDLESRNGGLAHVRMWSARVARLPLSVESTAELVQASQETGDKHATRSAYSLALIRFVNGQIDKAQNGVYARSVAAVAAELNIPDWIIDIRHDATHKTTPALPVLRRATRHALNWLEERYWKPQTKFVADAKQQVKTHLDKYLALQREVVLSERENKKTNKTALTLTLEQMSSYSLLEQHAFVSLLASSLAATSYDMTLWRTLLNQLNRTRPSNLAHLLYLTCQTHARDVVRNKHFSNWLDQLIAQGLFNDKCKQLYPTYVLLLLSGPSNCRALCQRILNYCTPADVATETRDVTMTTRDVTMTTRDVAMTTNDVGKYSSLRELFNILSEGRTRSDCEITQQISRVKGVLNQLQQERSSEREKGAPKRRFQLCGDEGCWSTTPLGCLPHRTSLSMELPKHRQVDCDGNLEEEMSALPGDEEPCTRHDDVMMTHDKKPGAVDCPECCADLGAAEEYRRDNTYDRSRLINIMNSVRMLDNVD